MQNAVFFNVKDLFIHEILTDDKMYIISWLFSETKIKIRNKGDDSVWWRERRKTEVKYHNRY
jgi:hypothetical protein